MRTPKPTPELDDTLAAPAASVRRPPSISPLPSSSERLAGRYELISLLGEGGMGTVYRARDLALDEIVALKVLRDELSGDEAMLARFRQEVKLARKVTHANVARTFDIGEHGGRKFLTMELIDGVSLAESLRAEPRLPFPRVLAIASAICAGLGAAHDAGIVHRDLKPENILLARDGRVVITDFGIACATERSGAVTRAGAAVGTPAYMAPEQVEGARDIDAQADIYALGAILFELWTGAPAWRGDSVFVIAARRLTEPPPDPRVLRPDLPELAAQVTMRCMARAKRDRFGGAREVATALLRCSASEVRPSPSTPPHLAGPTLKTVAVVPLRNAGPLEDDYLADGLTDDLVDVLSMTPGIRVCARGLVAARTPQTADPRQLGLALGVQVVVFGSLQRAAGRLRANVRVLSVGDGFQLWAKRLDHSEDAFFEVSDIMARAVAEALTCNVGAPREAPRDARALDLYLRARHEYHKFWTDNVVRSVDLFEQALALAPDDPMILAAYAMALARRCGFDDGTADHGEKSRRAADRALTLSPGLGTAKVARAYQRLLGGETLAGARDLREVLEVSPDSVDALELSGRLLAEAGALEEGIRRLTRALELEPILAIARVDLARLHALRGDRATSEAFFGEEPADPGLASLYWVNRGRVALWQRDFERAASWRSVLETRTDLFPAVRLLFLALTRDPSFAAEVKSSLAAMTAPSPLRRRRAFYAVIMAEFSQFLRETEMALAAIEQADESRLFDISWLDRSPTLEPLRTHPRFIAARDRVAARAAEVRAALGVEGGTSPKPML
jgi:TolB-like protein/predicted Ser/Thr protein kinase